MVLGPRLGSEEGDKDGFNDGDIEGAWHDAKTKLAEKLLFAAAITCTSIDATELSSRTDILPLHTFVPDPVGTNVTKDSTAES